MKSKSVLRAALAVVVLASLSGAAGAAGASPARAEGVKDCPIAPPDEPGVYRLGGSDRYAVSATISQAAFVSTGGTVYIASGETFPDALSGSAAAGLDGAPVLLVTRTDVTPEVRSELIRLAPRRIVVLGGTATISTELESSLGSFAPIVDRIAGADRFEVSANIARSAFSRSTRTAYVASGSGFADALSASAAAGAEDGPVLLVERDEVPVSIVRALASFPDLERIIVVGGPSSVSDAVVGRLAAFASTTRISGVDRFEVSVNTSRDEFCSNLDAVLIASGAVFSDALAGSAAATAFGSPVLLVAGDAIPDAVARELRRLNPDQIGVLGGPNTISDGVLEQLKDYVRS
ncbi:cell wall-binding repeat-containing protein [Herbiconiux sp.]|uniref:cell wall-binding repeat-containing protein n=1 Tax=Herbiconiux sp. TaxID=1871186 RepID=UPI0025B8967B|nr:cell wall-binding repeat-containing protein [Herbiconiux sp.]